MANIEESTKGSKHILYLCREEKDYIINGSEMFDKEEMVAISESNNAAVLLFWCAIEPS